MPRPTFHLLKADTWRGDLNSYYIGLQLQYPIPWNSWPIGSDRIKPALTAMNLNPPQSTETGTAQRLDQTWNTGEGPGMTLLMLDTSVRYALKLD